VRRAPRTGLEADDSSLLGRKSYIITRLDLASLDSVRQFVDSLIPPRRDAARLAHLQPTIYRTQA